MTTCAICNKVMDVTGDVKSEICPTCNIALYSHGVDALTTDALIDWINNEDVWKLRDILIVTNFRFDTEENDVDTAVYERLGVYKQNATIPEAEESI